MNAVPDRASVVIIGGGPAGLTTAILLARRGIDVQLFERRATTTHLPRAHLLNLRTMEIFRSMGISDDVHALSPPEDRWHRVGWYTSLSGDLPGQGQEIGHVHAWGGGPDRDRYAAASPETYANVPQMRLDPLLRRHADAACPGRIHFGHEVVAMRQHDGQVEVDVLDTSSGATSTVTATYAVAADGGRLCSDLLGVEMIGPTQLLDMVSMHVTADLSTWIVDDEVLLYYFIDPHGQGSFRGSICAMGPDTWGSDSREWAFHQAFAWGDPAAKDVATLESRVREMLGLPDLEFEVHAISHWEFEGVTASRFREGNVFLTGNAAHRHPPTGGLGLNTAVQDAHNLAWKLALVLEGRADDVLLDSYDEERHPVGEFNVQHSLRNAGGHRRIAAALGLTADQEIEDGWKQIDTWQEHSEAGQARRDAVREAVSSNSDDYSQLNVEIGFAYDSAAIVGDGTSPPATHGGLRDYTPTTRPGHHLPHAFLELAGRRVSTLDLVADDALTLIVSGEQAGSWRNVAAAVESEVRIVEVGVGPQADAHDVYQSWARLNETGAEAVLVRPDWHVAWRSGANDTPAAEILTTVVAQVLHGKDAS